MDNFFDGFLHAWSWDSSKVNVLVGTEPNIGYIFGIVINWFFIVLGVYWSWRLNKRTNRDTGTKFFHRFRKNISNMSIIQSLLAIFIGIPIIFAGLSYFLILRPYNGISRYVYFAQNRVDIVRFKHMKRMVVTDMDLSVGSSRSSYSNIDLAIKSNDGKAYQVHVVNSSKTMVSYLREQRKGVELFVWMGENDQPRTIYFLKDE
ncbi:Uncharacterised protein [Streptococcus criceti]|uniref:Uncharacterized protein n=1 Tax=Streptococcus criceti HS-6 TaxID=873449 RepID=G5JPX5_STRCG|nr:hypothetical protein [Streptococcus criceti]EHI75376.1 hypothetical protein STRCR_1710 [Streptococcus criceti HS-6]SUN43181.1 Uncharacterised protein [Streptococcus criceti]